MSPVGTAALPKPTVPDYDLLGRIDAGAYGEVWLARSKATGVLRAAKIVWRHTFEDDRPFQREFEGIQRFEKVSREHPSQLALFHIGRNEAEGYFYYVMELADAVADPKSETAAAEEGGQSSNFGQPSNVGLGASGFYSPHTLRADLEQGRLAAGRVLEIGMALAEALGHLHQHGLVHRDVKPSNVIFVNGRPKLADIGLVTDASDQCSIVGTEGYLPPEGPGTPQGDIFALGRVLYEAATGLDRREFPKLPVDLRAWPEAKLVFELNEIVLKACANDARARYASVEAMLGDLQLLQHGKSVRRSRAVEAYWAAARKAGIALAGLGALVAVTAVIMRGSARSGADPDGLLSKNADANMFCEKGMGIIRNDIYAQLGEAYTNFVIATELDTNFARPYVGLLEMALREPVKNAPEMRRMATRRLRELAPGLGATSVAQSIDSFYDLDFPAAERFALQGIKASANYELGHTWYTFMLCHWGRERLREARQQIEISERLRPGKAIVQQCKGHAFYAQRDFTNAILCYNKALELDRHHWQVFSWLSRAQRATGDYLGSIDTDEQGALVDGAEDESKIREQHDRLRRALKDDREHGFWEQAWEDERARPARFYLKATIQIHLGNTNQALGLLEDSFRNKDLVGINPQLAYLLFDECWDGLRDNPEFRQLLKDVGFTKVMKARERPRQR